VRTVVVGAGIVGVTTAFELALLGHEVHVLERCASVAAEGSFADAGLAGPAWVAAATAGSAAGALPGGGTAWPVHWLHGIRRWHRSRGAAGAQRSAALAALARLSAARRLEHQERLQIDHEQTRGLLWLLQGSRALRAAKAQAQALQAAGLGAEVLDAERARTLEPALAAAAGFDSALYLPQDGAGNCRQFAHGLRAQAQRLGARFAFGTTVRRIEPGARPAVHLADGQIVAADAVVLCTGEAALQLLPGAARLPAWTLMHGASVTAPLSLHDGMPDGAQAGPRASVLEHRSGVTITRLRDRVRAAGPLAAGAGPATPAPRALAALYRALERCFPGAAVQSQARHWQGRCLATADGLPVLGDSGIPGIWLNLAHGGHGWALASGAAQCTAAVVDGQAAPLDIAPFAVKRR
jgi:D-amino-acid dehydrogenase